MSALRIGGFLASAVLIIGGIATILVGMDGRSEVRDQIAQENIVGTPDMSPELIESEYTDELPDCDVAGEEITTGSEARCFADYMRIHQLDTSEGLTYAEIPRFLDEEGEPTGDAEEAAMVDGRPMDNPVRQTWVTYTALSTALNTSFFAENVAQFAIWMGFALVLIGIGLAILAWHAMPSRGTDTAPER